MINPSSAFLMSNRLIVERHKEDSWKASFLGLPGFGATAKHPFSAIQNLIDRSGDPSLSFDTLRPIVESTQDHHWEFEIPRADDWRLTILAN